MKTHMFCVIRYFFTCFTMNRGIPEQTKTVNKLFLSSALQIDERDSLDKIQELHSNCSTNAENN